MPRQLLDLSRGHGGTVYAPARYWNEVVVIEEEVMPLPTVGPGPWSGYKR